MEGLPTTPTRFLIFIAVFNAAIVAYSEPAQGPDGPRAKDQSAPVTVAEPAGKTEKKPEHDATESGEVPLPANPSPAASEEMLLPGEISLVPPTPKLPNAGQTPSQQPLPPFSMRPAEPEIRPTLPPLPTAMAGGAMLSSALRIRVKEFRFKGNHVISDRTLRKVVASYTGRVVTSTELEEAREKLTLKYVDAGYINSGAVLPEQDFKSGVITFKIVEGKLTTINLSGYWWFRPWWLRHVLRESAGDPLNFERLKTGLQLIREDPNIRQINAELEPGAIPGESILKTEVKENQPFRLGLEFSNKRPPSVGSEIFELHAADLNLTGHGDPLSLTWGPLHTTSDTMQRWTFRTGENLAGSYEFPVSPWKTTVELHAGKSDSAIVEAPFNTLNINSRLEQYGATLRQPFYESLNHLFDVSITGDWRKSETFLLGQPFDLSPGSVGGIEQVFVLRLAMEYVNRSQEHVLALRSTFNFGLDAFGATRHDQVPGSGGAGQVVEKIPDGRFFYWLEQAQFVRRLFNTDTVAVLRLNAQLSNNPLLSLEQFSLGGVNTVRGYRENQVLTDDGVFGSIEVRVPVWRNKEKSPIVALAPFFDIGAGWDTIKFVGPAPSSIDDNNRWLSSVGIGVIATPSKYCAVQIYWGYALNPSETVKNGKNLQDYGLHFDVSVNAF